jgi:hypothetical protein
MPESHLPTKIGILFCVIRVLRKHENNTTHGIGSWTSAIEAYLMSGRTDQGAFAGNKRVE